MLVVGRNLMISHAEFSDLTLLEFCLSDPSYAYEEDEHGDLMVETIFGIEFFRHSRVASGTLMIRIDLLISSNDVGPAILSRLGIPLTRRSTFSDAVAFLGKPVKSKIDPDRGYDYFRTDHYNFRVQPPGGYDIFCSWLYPGTVGRIPPLRGLEELSLWSVGIDRSDLNSFPWSDT
jgi:hypothetical protein